MAGSGAIKNHFRHLGSVFLQGKVYLFSKNKIIYCQTHEYFNNVFCLRNICLDGIKEIKLFLSCRSVEENNLFRGNTKSL